VTAFDFVAILILGVSALVGFVRGATRELMTVIAFLLAIMISVFGLRFTGPIFRHAIHTPWLANAAAILVVFIAAYIVIKVLGSALTRRIHNTRALGTVDRFIGVGFGILRGLVVLGVFNLAFNAATPPERVPHWMKDAVLYPVSTFAAHMLTALAPQGSAMAGKVAPALEQAVKDGASDKPVTAGKGYDDKARRSMDDAVEQNR
jgi:membrane protein required for colicin V production